MNIREYVDGLFADYPNSGAMNDFKEELCSNLSDRIHDLEKKGIDSKEAFRKATAELGDISEIAEQISSEKRREVFEAMYMKTRNYMNKWQIIGYTVAGGLLAFGIIIALLAYLRTGDPVAGIGSLIAFLIVPVCGFVFLGLTQETARNHPMSWKRAAFYTVDAAVILFGLITFIMMFFIRGEGLPTAIATLIPFALPGSIVLVFLILTEKNRNKPWVREQEAAWAERMGEPFSDPHVATRFGLFSGALWIFAIALFIALGFLVGFQYSWLVFLFAVAAQVLIQALMMPKK